MLRRQLLQGFSDFTAHLIARYFAKRVTLFRGYFAELILGLLAMSDRIPGFPPPPIDCQVGRDAVQPGRKTRPPLEASQILEGPDKGLLAQLTRVVNIMDQRAGNVNDPLLIALDQHSERFTVAALRAPDQVEFVVLKSASTSQFG